MTEKSFSSETAVKYRIRKMEKTCGVGTRMDLVRFLKDFLERSWQARAEGEQARRKIS